MTNNLANNLTHSLVNSLDGLNKFIVYSLIAHIIIIFGFSIKWYAQRSYSSQAIDVTFVSNRTKEKPENPDYLAQANNTGGGISDQKNQPSNQFQAFFPDDELKEITQEIKDLRSFNQQDLLTNQISYKNNALTTQQSSLFKSNSSEEINNSLLKNNQEQPVDFTEQPPEISQLSSLISKIEERAELIAKRPKKRFVSASTQQDRDAAYLINWREKIEYYGNKYYPDQARNRNLSGEVLVLVAVKSDGSLEKVQIERSSGIKILDEAAIQTVHLAAPFPPFPQEMGKDTDILEIVRTWRFNKDKLTTG
jgi:protein TonB